MSADQDDDGTTSEVAQELEALATGEVGDPNFLPVEADRAVDKAHEATHHGAHSPDILATGEGYDPNFLPVEAARQD